MTGTTAGARPKTHRVLPGDSLWSISEQHGVSIGALRRANAMPSDDDHIAAGERVVVPNYAARHVAVREGDTVAALARAFATTPEEIARHNPDAVGGGDALRAGAELYLPRRDLATGLRQLRAPRSMLEPARDADRTTFWGMFTHTRDVEYYRSCARTRPLLDALRMVETSNIMPAPVGDGGASIGPLQISKVRRARRRGRHGTSERRKKKARSSPHPPSPRAPARHTRTHTACRAAWRIELSPGRPGCGRSPFGGSCAVCRRS